MNRMKHGSMSQQPYGRHSEGDGLRSSRDLKPARLQKKSSVVGHEYGDHDTGMGHFYTRAIYEAHGVDSSDNASRARKGSIRSAVRKIFGRRSREPYVSPEPTFEGEPLAPVQELRPLHITPPRHGYHSSEPPPLPLQSQTERGGERPAIVPRTLSVPVPFKMADPHRTRSPYAVEFPHSARLKPLALGDPFYAPGSRLRRRKTLPSLQISETDATVIANAIKSAQEPSQSRSRGERDSPELNVGGKVPMIVNQKRFSRSADDLRKELTSPRDPACERADEIRHLRESFQANVLRASGFYTSSVSPANEDVADGDLSALPQAVDPSLDSTHHLESTPQSTRDLRQPDLMSPSAIGTEMSRELEERVAKLESNLQQFSDELRRITTGRNRGTVVVDGLPQRPASSSRNDGRTASMLIDNLDFPAVPCASPYSHPSTQARPSTSPRPPLTPVYAPDGLSAVVPPTPSPPREIKESTFDPSLYFRSNDSSLRSTNVPADQPMPSHTFRSLYEMLADERAARRKLEMQMRGLRQQLLDLQYQVSMPSTHGQSPRSSYYGPAEPISGSARLQALLHDTETTVLDDSKEDGEERDRHQSYVDLVAPEQEKMISRFSGESEAIVYADSDALDTANETYHTPWEEDYSKDRFHFTTADNEMF